MSLFAFLKSHQRGPGQKHTHTWFAAQSVIPKYNVKTLSIDEPARLRALLLSHAKSSPDLRRDCNSCNSITEKVSEKTTPRFRFFVDVDVEIEAIREWARGRSDWKSELIQSLQQLVETCRDTVTASAGTDVQIIVASRLPYKLHLHFPDVVTDKERAIRLCAAIKAQFASSDLFVNAMDSSVYTTGLRLLWCHKGAMSKGKGKDDSMDKTLKERKAHEELFGAESWSAIYEITNLDTWEKKATRSLQDLELTSILTDEATPVTPLDLPNEPTSKRKSSGAVRVAKQTRGPSQSGLHDTGDNSVPLELCRAICNEFGFAPDELNWGSRTRHDASITLPTRSKNCEFAAREHTSNHVYLVLSKAGIDLRCHSSKCKESRLLTKTEIPEAAARELDTELGIITPEHITDDMRVAAVTETIGELRKLPQGRNLDLSVEPGRICRTDLGDNESWLCKLIKNRYCPICDKEHDEPQNCVLICAQRLKLLCYKDDFRTSLSVPLLERQGNVIFANQIVNNNLNITVTSPEEVSADGLFDDVPPIFDDSVLNRLLLRSFNGFSYNIAKVIYHLAKENMGLSENKEVDVWWVWDAVTLRWQKDSRLAGSFLSEQIADTYQQVRKWFRENTQDEKLRNLRDGKLESIVKRLQDKDKRLILRDTAEVFTVAGEIPMEKRLDQNPFLLGFKGETYNLQTGERKMAEATDHVSMSTGYELPKDINPEIRANLQKLLSDIQPQTDEREYLLRFLASTLDGCNADEIFTIWTGNGRNGKGVLQELMMETLGDDDNGYYASIASTMLTNERPDSSKPIPDVLNLRGKRYASASEPQEGKGINAGFVKWLTGNDPISGTYKHRNEEIKFRGQHSLILLCNNIPSMNSEDTALWDRARVQHFAMKFVDNPRPDTNERQIDRRLKNKVKEWAGQFMLLLLDYYKKYQAEGLAPPPGVLRATNKVKDDNDPCLEFINEFYEFTECNDDRIGHATINAHFKAWCQKGEQDTPRRRMATQVRKALAKLKDSMIAYGFEDKKGRVAGGESELAWFKIRERAG